MMMGFNIKPGALRVCAALLFGFASSNASAQDIVYEVPATGPFIYSYTTQGWEYADGAQLGGTSRYAQTLSVPVYSKDNRSVTVTASIYAAAPFDPTIYTPAPSQPGTSSGPVDALQPGASRLWTSGPITFSLAASNPLAPSLDYLVFNNINTLLPDTVFWSLQFNTIGGYASDGSGFGMIYRNAANVAPGGAATDATRFFIRDTSVSNAWSPYFLTTAPGTFTPQSTSTFGVQLTAIPVPEASPTMLVACAAGLLFRRRRA